MKGVPLRIEIGARDLVQNKATIVARLTTEKQQVALDEIGIRVTEMLDTLQKSMLERARERMMRQWYKEAKLADFGKKLSEENGFYQTGWCRNADCEKMLKEYGATTRCLLEERSFDVCFNCDEKSVTDVLVARAY
jgi:prolyl-tRNA synthetase